MGWTWLVGWQASDHVGMHAIQDEGVNPAMQARGGKTTHSPSGSMPQTPVWGPLAVRE